MIEEGVYILEGSFQTGTGHTGKARQAHRSLWATCEVSGEAVTLMLLDEKGQPTGVTETISLQLLKTGYRYQALSAETWALLRGRVQSVYRPRTPGRPADQPAPAGPPAESAPLPEGGSGGDNAEPASDDPFDTTPWWQRPRK